MFFKGENHKMKKTNDGIDMLNGPLAKKSCFSRYPLR